MLKSRLSNDYEDGVEIFLRRTLENTTDPEKKCCPCEKCFNLQKWDVIEIKSHLTCNGIDETYQTWIWHREKSKGSEFLTRFQRREDQSQDRNFDDPMVDMVRDVHERFEDWPGDFIKLVEDIKKYINTGSKMTKLTILVKLYNLKPSSGWSDKNFSKLLALMKELLPKQNEMPSSLYKTKKKKLCAH